MACIEACTLLEWYNYCISINLFLLPCHASEKPLIISYNGASGDYPSCTDLAYTKAISDGVDVLDCNVQMTKDGTPICLSSINLMDSTKVAQTPFSTFTTTITELQKGSGIFTFNLTWENISSLTRKLKLEHVLSELNTTVHAYTYFKF